MGIISFGSTKAKKQNKQTNKQKPYTVAWSKAMLLENLEFSKMKLLKTNHLFILTFACGYI